MLPSVFNVENKRVEDVAACIFLYLRTKVWCVFKVRLVRKLSEIYGKISGMISGKGHMGDQDAM